MYTILSVPCIPSSHRTEAFFFFNKFKIFFSDMLIFCCRWRSFRVDCIIRVPKTLQRLGLEYLNGLPLQRHGYSGNNLANISETLYCPFQPLCNFIRFHTLLPAQHQWPVTVYKPHTNMYRNNNINIQIYIFNFYINFIVHILMNKLWQWLIWEVPLLCKPHSAMSKAWGVF